MMTNGEKQFLPSSFCLFVCFLFMSFIKIHALLNRSNKATYDLFIWSDLSTCRYLQYVFQYTSNVKEIWLKRFLFYAAKIYKCTAWLFHRSNVTNYVITQFSQLAVYQAITENMCLSSEGQYFVTFHRLFFLIMLLHFPQHTQAVPPKRQRIVLNFFRVLLYLNQ